MPVEATNDLLTRRPDFLRFVRRRVPNPAQAEDLLQTAYARALSKQAELKSADSVVAWFYRILRHAIIDHLRRRQVEERLFDSEAVDVASGSTEQEPSRNTCKCVHGALEQITPAYREILRDMYLSDDEPEPMNALAQRSGITAGNAAVRAHRARRALKTTLSRTCGACADAGCLDCTCS